MISITEASGLFRISHLGVWQLIRQNKIVKSSRPFTGDVQVNREEIKSLFEKEPELWEEMKRKK